MVDIKSWEEAERGLYRCITTGSEFQAFLDSQDLSKLPPEFVELIAHDVRVKLNAGMGSIGYDNDEALQEVRLGDGSRLILEFKNTNRKGQWSIKLEPQGVSAVQTYRLANGGAVNSTHFNVRRGAELLLKLEEGSEHQQPATYNNANILSTITTLWTKLTEAREVLTQGDKAGASGTIPA
jgi:hypothetical protein